MTRAAATHKNGSISRALGTIYDKAIDWLYSRNCPDRAKPYTLQLRRLVDKSDPEREAIFTHECLALADEAEGNLAQAIKHRLEEIRLIRRLHKLARGQDSRNADYIFRQYGPADLRDRLYLLARLYGATGNLRKAIASLEESKKVCEASGIKFEQEKLLRKYLRETNASPA